MVDPVPRRGEKPSTTCTRWSWGLGKKACWLASLGCSGGRAGRF